MSSVVSTAVDAVLSAARAARATSAWHEPEPEPGDWRMGPRSIAFLAALIEAVRPLTVLEFGSGASTISIGRALQARGAGRLVSLEHDPVHVAATARQLNKASLTGYVELISAPLVARRHAGRWAPEYHLADDDHNGRQSWADMVLVDGPPLPLGGRHGSLSHALRAARPGAVIVLDDARRDSERELLELMLDEHGARLVAMNLLGFSKGLAALIVTDPGSPGCRGST